jgi:hypothetical protein
MNIFISILLSLNLIVHDIHLSICEITSLKNDTIEIKVKIFYDDLQLAMGLFPGEELPKKYKNSDELIKKYLVKNLNFFINGNKTQFEYIHSELALPAVWTTLQIKSISASNIKEIKIKNKILIDLYNDQENIIHIKLNKEQSYKLNKQQIEASFEQ